MHAHLGDRQSASFSDFRHRTNQIRVIAEGLFDQTEWKLVLLFVDDCETRFAAHERSMAGVHNVLAESRTVERTNGGADR